METIQHIKSKADKINPQKKEGHIAKAIEEQTAKVPSECVHSDESVVSFSSFFSRMKLIRVTGI